MRLEAMRGNRAAPTYGPQRERDGAVRRLGRRQRDREPLADDDIARHAWL